MFEKLILFNNCLIGKKYRIRIKKKKFFNINRYLDRKVKFF